MSRSLEAAYADGQVTGKLKLVDFDLSELPQTVCFLGDQNYENVPGYLIQELTSLKVSGNKFTSLPDALMRLETLVILDLSRNALASIDNIDFSAFSRLEVVDLSANALETVPDSLVNAAGLKALRLNGNRLSQLSLAAPSLVEVDISGNALVRLDLAARMLDLAVLRLHQNRLVALPDDLGDAVPRVSELTLAGNRLRALPLSTGLLVGLVTLDVADNALTELPDLRALSRLHTLIADGNSIESLPVAALCGCGALQTIRMRSNHMASVPETVASLAALVTLDLSMNDLAALPAELSLCPALRHVNVEGNPLRAIRRQIVEKGSAAVLAFLASRLPEGHPQAPAADVAAAGIGRFSVAAAAATRTLDLSGQGLRELPRALLDDGAAWAAFREIRLDGNALVQLPSELGGAGALELLSAGRNGLEAIPRALCVSGAPLAVLLLPRNRITALPDLRGLSRTLTSLDLSYNPRLAPGAAIGALTSLTSLALCGCGLEALPEGTERLTALRSLSLESNALASVDAVVSLSRLETLDLQNNAIMTLPPELGSEALFPNLTALLFAGNLSKVLVRVALKGTVALRQHLARQ